MTGYLLDTNLISELTRDDPDQQVVAFLTEQDDLWLSSILVHEVEYGLRLLPEGRRRRRLAEMQAGILSEYANRILPLDRTGAGWAAELRANARRLGSTIDVGDALVAGIARANALTLATRNVSDFRYLDVEVVNPWNPP